MILGVEFDGLGEQTDGGIIVLGLEGLVSLIFKLVGLRNLISDPRFTRPGGTAGRTVDMTSEPGGDPCE